MGRNRVGPARQCGCRFEQSAPTHHDRLIAIESEPLQVLAEMAGMAASWDELEYGLDEPVIAPDDWIEFAETHAWSDRATVLDAMIALSSYAPRRGARAVLGSVTPLFVVPDERVSASG